MDASTTKTQNDAGSQLGGKRRKTPLDELRDHYSRGAFNVFQTALFLYLLVDAAHNGRWPWLIAFLCALQICGTALSWKTARDEWKRAKSRYEPADEPCGENSVP